MSFIDYKNYFNDFTVSILANKEIILYTSMNYNIIIGNYDVNILNSDAYVS